MKILLLILLTIELGSCDNENRDIMVCNEHNAKKITTAIIEVKGDLKANELTSTIEEDSLHYTIEYLPKDTMMRGGGGKFKVSKSNCEVIESEFYQ